MHIKVRFFEKRGFSSHNTHIHIGFIIRERKNYDDENIVNKEYLKKNHKQNANRVTIWFVID